MHNVQTVEIFLPLNTGTRDRGDVGKIDAVMADLANRFGGATAFTREPAEGLWKQADEMESDHIVIVEVMVEDLDESWWKDYRQSLEDEFEQDEILIRATPCRRL